MVWRDSEAGLLVQREGIISGFDMELAPQGVDVFLLVVHAGVLHHVIPDGRMGAIGPNHEVELDLDLSRAAGCGFFRASNLEPRLAGAEVSACQLVVEEDLDVGHLLQYVEELLVQPGAIYREDGLYTSAFCGSVSMRG